MQITAFQTVPKPMVIRPASNRRQWMDDTVHQFAYRCLPLQIANAAGWELLAPSDFLVTWNGSDHKSGLTAHYSEESWEFAASSFGYGIVTFHPGYLFKTISNEDSEEPNFDLYVTGSPNYWYDFMVPLTGIVETFWNDATFTMNWKLLRPGTFEIKKDQPLAFLMPIPHERGEIDARIVDIRKNPQVLKDYNTWASKRSRTIKALDMLEKTGQGIDGIDPNNPSTQWERTYFQGKTQTGEKVKEHQTKRRMPEFKRTDNAQGN